MPAAVPDEAAGSAVTPSAPTAPPSAQQAAAAHAPTLDYRDACAPFVYRMPDEDQPMPAADPAGIQQAAWMIRSVEPDGVNRAAAWLDAWPRTESGWAARLDVLRAMNPGTALDAIVPNPTDRGALTDLVLTRLANSTGVDCTREAVSWTRLLVWPLGSTRTDDSPLGATLDRAVQTSFEVCGGSSRGRADLVIGLHETARMLGLQAGPDARLALLRALQNVVAVRFPATTQWTIAVDVQLLHALAGMMPDGCTPAAWSNGQAPDALNAIAESMLSLSPASDGEAGELYAVAPAIALVLQLAAGSAERDAVAVWAARAVERGMDPRSAALSARRLQAAIDAVREDRALTEVGADLFHPAQPPSDLQEHMILQGIRLWEHTRTGNCTDVPVDLASFDDPLVRLTHTYIWGRSDCHEHARPWYPRTSVPADTECRFTAGSVGARLTDAPTTALRVVYHEAMDDVPVNVPTGAPRASVRLASLPQTTVGTCQVATPAGSHAEPYTLWAPFMEPRPLEADDGLALGQQSEPWLRRAYLIQYGNFETLGGGGTALARAARSATPIPGQQQVQRLVHAGLPLSALQVDRARVQLAALTGAAREGEPLTWNLRRADVPEMLNGVQMNEAVPRAYVSFMNELAVNPGGYAPAAAVEACRALAANGFGAEANGVPPLFCDSASTAAEFSACLDVALRCNTEQPLFGADAVNLLLQSLRLAVGTGQLEDRVVAAVAQVIATQTGSLPDSLLVELHAHLVQARWIERDFEALEHDAAATRALFERAAGDARDYARVYGTLELLARVASGHEVDTARLRAWSSCEQGSALFDLLTTLEQAGDSEATRDSAVDIMQTYLTSRDAFTPAF